MQPRGVAFVTGGGRGIGRAVATELAERGFGVVAGVREPERVLPFPPELGSPRLEAFDARQASAWKPPAGLRVLVNNAGVDAPHAPLERTPLADWRSLFETNVFGLVETTRRAIPALRASGGGVICNLTSASLVFPMPFYAAYRASKAAVAALGDSLRAELAEAAIRVLEVLPGPVRTDMLEASAAPPPAADDPYAALALRVEAGRLRAVGAAVAPEHAARRIVDAILDDASPQRVACDPLGEALLAGRRAAPDEETWTRALLAGLGVDPGAS